MASLSERQGGRLDSHMLNIAIGLEGLALGGCPINAIDLGRIHRTRGHNVSIFAIDEDVQLSLLPVAKRAGFKVDVFPAHSSSLQRARQIRRFADRCAADIVHVYGPWMGPAASVALAGRPRRAAVVTNWTMENVDYTPPGTTMIVGTRQLQVEAAPRHRGPVELVEPPVDVEADQPDPESGRRFRSQWDIDATCTMAVIVSRLDTVMKAESIGYAIQAVGRLAVPDLRLVVVGDGDARAGLEECADEVNRALGRYAVVFTGALLDPRPAYDAADITFGMGGSALRALAHAKPLIVLGVNGFAKTFEPGTVDYFYENGFFGVEETPDPAIHLSRELSRLLERPTRDQLSEFGAAEVRRRFSLETGARQLEEIYRRALSDSPPSAIRLARSLGTGTRLTLHEARTRLGSVLDRQQLRRER